MARAPARRTVGSWEIEDVIGSGSFAIVWKARHAATGELAAVKEILTDKLNKKLQESLNSEIAVLQRVKHANIVGLQDLYKEPGKIFLVLEYCGGGDLAHHLRQRGGPLSEASARYLLRQLAEGLKVMRQHNIIHRDLKPQNLLLSDAGPSPTLKIADFGFARSLQPAGLAETLCGSPLYMAPEVLQLHKYDAKADLWSVGTILFELLTGKPPFNGANHLQLVQNIERGDAVLPDAVARSLSPACRQLLHQLLRRNPVERISFDELFAHPFLTGDGDAAPGLGVSSSSPTSSGLCVPGAGAYALRGGPCPASAAGAELPLQPQRRHTPTSHGAVRFVQPQRYGNPVHPAYQVSPTTSAQASQQARQQQPADPAAAGAAISVREITRSPSPRIVAATAAVECAMAADAAAAAAAARAGAVQTVAAGGEGPRRAYTYPEPLPPVAAVPAGGGGRGGSSDGRSLGDSDDSDYVVVASPSAVHRPYAQQQQQLARRASSPLAGAPASPRTPHPAMAGGGSRNSSVGGAATAAPPPAVAPPGGAGAAAGAAAALLQQGPLAAWQAQPPPAAALMPQPHAAATASPIAAATLPQGQPSPYSAAVPGAHVARPEAGTVVGPTVAKDAAAAERSPAPTPGGPLDTALLQRVIRLLLDLARSRCTALLDLEAEMRQAPDMAGGGAFGLSGIGASGLGAGGGAASAALTAAGLADEAAAAVGSLLCACRLLATALGGGAAGSGVRGGGGGGAGGGRAAADGPPSEGAGTAERGSGGEPVGSGEGAVAVEAAAERSGMQDLARTALAALDEHLCGTVGQLLAAEGVNPSLSAAPGAEAPLVPCSVDTLLAAAVHHSRAAAGEELLGSAASAADQYGRAADVLLFLLAAPPNSSEPEEAAIAKQQQALLDAVRPPLAPHDRQRLLKYHAAVRLRQTAAQAAAAGVGGVGPPSQRYGGPSLEHHSLHAPPHVHGHMPPHAQRAGAYAGAFQHHHQPYHNMGPAALPQQPGVSATAAGGLGRVQPYGPTVH